jgi:hypothetical protein
MAEPSHNLDYPKLTQQSFPFGVGLFLVGVLVALAAPFVFGIFLPLTE